MNLILGASRDDNPMHWPQSFEVTEYHFQYLIKDPYYFNATIPRLTHGYMAMPSDIQHGELLPAYIALNGHRGSAWLDMFPSIFIAFCISTLPLINYLKDASDIYWFGNAFGRRRFIVYAVDISHRNDSPLYHDQYIFGDDRIIACALLLLISLDLPKQHMVMAHTHPLNQVCIIHLTGKKTGKELGTFNGLLILYYLCLKWILIVL